MENKITFSDIFNMPVVESENGIHYRCFYHWKYFDEDINYRLDTDAVIEQGRVKTCFVKKHCFDGRRTWELGYITFDGQPVMFFYAYGRDGVDGYGNAIVNESLRDDLIKYLKSLCDYEDYELETICTLNDDATWMTNFYGCDISEIN